MSRNFNNFGNMLIGKAERPGPSLSPSTRAPQPSLEREEYGKMANDILHYSRLQKDSPCAPSVSGSQTETASLSSVATEKRSLLSRFRKDSASKSTSEKKTSPLSKDSKRPNV